MGRPTSSSLNSDIVPVTGNTVAKASEGQHTRSGQSRPATVSLGGAYTPDTRRLTYGTGGVGGGGGGGGKKASQRHKSQVHGSDSGQ